MEPRSNSQQPPNVQEGFFTRIGRRFDSFIGARFRNRQSQVIIGPDGSQVDNPQLIEKANLLGEKIYHAYVLGRLNFLSQTDGVSDETPAMRREYWKWVTTEPALEAAIWTKVTKVISNQLVMQPASKSPYDKAVAEWVKDCLIRSAGGLRKILEQVFYHGLVWGNVLCEPLWKLSESPEWKAMFPHGYYTLKDVTARDPADYRVEIDGHRNVIGVWTTKTNEWFPPTYFLRWANRPIYGNPAGTSGVRSSRRACMLLKSAQTYRGIYLEQFGLPMMKGSYKRGDDEGYSIAEAAIQRARAMGYILLPDGVDLEAMQIAARGESEYQESIDDLRKEIFLAQTGSYLFAMEGDTSDGAGNSETHKSTLDLAVWYLCSVGEELLNDQLIPWIVQLNCYNASLPRASIGGVDDSDLKASLEIDTGLYNMGMKLDEDELYERYHRSPPSSPDKAVWIGNKVQSAGQGLPLPNQSGQQLPVFSAQGHSDTELFNQTTPYTCGPASLHYAVSKLAGVNDNIGEGVISHELGTTPHGGTAPADIIRVARQYGLNVQTARQMSMQELRQFTDQGSLVITPIQTGGSQQSRADNAEGHYIVVKRVDNDSGLVGYFDPATSNDTEWVPINHFVSNWHDRDENGKLFTRFGIVLGGDQKGQQFDAGPHKFACIMAMPDESIAALAQEIQSQIDPSDLGEKDIEDELHITVLYGCEDSDLGKVQATLATTPPFKITFGQLLVLTPNEGAFLSNVLAVRVYGEAISNLHHKLQSELSATVFYPTFCGHMTLAYLKPGTAAKYMDEPNKSLLLGEVGLVESLVFRQTDGQGVQVDLGGVSLLPIIDFEVEQFTADPGNGIPNPVNHEVAIAGPDGYEVARLLREAKERGIEVLHDICQSAFARKFTPDGGGPLLFSQEERDKLTEAFQETLASASLLGQSAVWLRYMRDEEETNQQRNQESTPFTVFDSSIKPLQPLQAIDYFRNLVPMLRVAPSFDADLKRKSFTLAAATEKTLLRSIHDALVDHLVTGNPVGHQEIQELLDKAGVTPRNPDYASMVFRTNMMDAYTQANSETLRDPQIQEAYPVWRYDGIDDGRAGEDHQPKFGKYYPSSAAFAEVRGKRPFNCRCSPRPVHKSEWARLQEQGAQVEHTWE